MSNFAMGTILGKGFAQAQVHTNHSMSAEGTSAVMYALGLFLLILFKYQPDEVMNLGNCYFFGY